MTPSPPGVHQPPSRKANMSNRYLRLSQTFNNRQRNSSQPPPISILPNIPIVPVVQSDTEPASPILPLPPRSINTDSEQDAILIGIDFGTTFSGVAWIHSGAWAGGSENINVVTNWPSYDYANSDKGKAPTEIHYPNSVDTRPDSSYRPTTLSSTAVKWGYGIPSGKKTIKWFKLLLLDECDMPEDIRNSPQIHHARDLLQQVGKTPTQAVADYLRSLWSHALVNIEEVMTQSVVEGIPFRVVLTVPAIWNHMAIRRMRQAAKDAGILDDRLCGETTLHFVSEPEAAALATFEDLRTRPNFQKGDSFVVCDAGGGTVDLISYKVHDINPMELRECVEGQGKLCGAVFLDEDFQALVKQLLGGDDVWDSIEPKILKKWMNTEWEVGIKRAFNGDERTWELTLPYHPTTGGYRTVELSTGHVEDIFDHVVDQIRAVVNEQINRVREKENQWPKAVVLVGGFGSCQYLFKKLQAENQTRGIDVMKSSGARPETAICRGAVIKALTTTNLPCVRVSSRISRLSYGFVHAVKFIEGYHNEEDRKHNHLQGFDEATNQMTWILRKGEDVWDKSPGTHSCRREVLECHISSGPQRTYEYMTSIYGCALDEPPSRRTSDVKPVSVMSATFDITSLPEQIGRNGIRYWNVRYIKEVNMSGSTLEFNVKYQDELLSHQNVELDLEDE